MNHYLEEETPIAQRTVVAQVMARLKDLIASGHYRPGTRIPTEKDLAQMFGVGRSSIREAIKVFQHLGVLESRTAKGTYVRGRAHVSSEAITWALLLGEDDLRDVLELREAIENICFSRLGSALAEGVPSARKTLELLDQQILTMEEAAEHHEISRMVEADYRFHELIVEAGGNRLFCALYASLHAFMSEEIRTSYIKMQDLHEVALDHADIVRTLRSEDSSTALRRHGRHFRRIRKLLHLPASLPATDRPETERLEMALAGVAGSEPVEPEPADPGPGASAKTRLEHPLEHPALAK
ncbi:FadR/GntR family transcriptional regulator [Alkalispirochaeta alkalica]|uniref:FadR/GntR family transcriptional regulator n=1 Tax=Alkalispirochaeta alkalica TaxID=46356 RepID=UPI0003819777|nr:GntR family transcriptional regulator [Alkalispirochaeta alkalica]